MRSSRSVLQSFGPGRAVAHPESLAAMRSQTSARPARPLAPVKAWILAARPKTLVAAMLPVMLTTALNARGQQIPWTHWAVPLAFAILMQVSVNFHNDLVDGLRGVDGPDRLGPARAVASGWISPQAMRRGVWMTIGLALGMSSLLCEEHPWLIPLAGFCVLGALSYTGGKRPLSDLGLGEVACLLFFGLIVVGGTSFLQTQTIHMGTCVVALCCGSYASALIAINNVRDLASDRRSGKCTLAVRWGETIGRAEVGFWCLLPVAVACLWGGWGSLAALPTSLILFRKLPAWSGAGWNQALALTALTYLLFSCGLVLQWHLIL
jgi:1,4-dihydroxy-2-naphthoate octaprenyltransferase